MNFNWLHKTCITICCCTGIIVGKAQPPRTVPVISPEIHADHKITFRYLAPAATMVKLSAQFEKTSLPMTRDSSGVKKHSSR